MNRERDSSSFRIASPRRRSTAVSARRFSLAASKTDLTVGIASPRRLSNDTEKTFSFNEDECQGMIAMKKSKSVLKPTGLAKDDDSWIPFAAETDFRPKPKKAACAEKLDDELTSSFSSGNKRFSRSKRAHRRSTSDDSLPSAQQTSSLSSCDKGSIDSTTKRLHKSFSAITMSPTKMNRRSSNGFDTTSNEQTESSRDKMLMRCYSSSSSLEENLRGRRRGRRPKIKTSLTRTKSDDFFAPTSLDDCFNQSIRLDFGEDEAEVAPKQAEFGVFDDSFETAATSSFRWGFGSSGNLESTTEDAEFFETIKSPPLVQASSNTLLYELAKTSQWHRVQKECLTNPWGAKHVGEEDGMTALHFAVMSRVNPYLRDDANAANQRASLQLIEALVKACPESASVRCSDKKYTPLSYACLVADEGYLMEDCAAIARILLEAAPYCALVISAENYSCLDIHIISYSKIHKHKEERASTCGRSSTAVLRTLIDLAPSLVQTRDYGEKVRGPIELLYRCNLKDFKAASSDDIRNNSRINAGCTSKGSDLSDWWAWKWTTLMLRSLSSQINSADVVGDHSFSVLHASAQMVGCPVPIICLAIEAYPEHVKKRGETNGKFNCPLHEVCSWVTDSIHINGDPILKRRKAKAISALLDAYPKAARMTNNHGETPLQLAVETSTAWNGGLEELVSTFPKALMLPRSLDDLPDDSPLANAMMYHDDDLGSVGFDEQEWTEESIGAIDGMYPFQIAAALSHVPQRRLHQQINLESSQGRTYQLQDRDMSSLTSIFGMLRARPQALGRFIKEEQEREAKKRMAASENTDQSSVATEETQEYRDTEF